MVSIVISGFSGNANQLNNGHPREGQPKVSSPLSLWVGQVRYLESIMTDCSRTTVSLTGKKNLSGHGENVVDR